MAGSRKVEAARAAADYLDSIGEHFHANSVRSLMRSNSSLIDTCSRLRRDIDDLREKIRA